jgi:hypothetical protein
VRLSRRLVAITTLLCAGLLATGAAANAATGDVTWTGQIVTADGTASTATVVYNPKTYYLDLQVSTGAVAAGRCVTVYFDWSAKGHHDARAVRDCQSNTTVSFAFPDATPSNIVGGPTKLGVCYAPDDKLGTCVLAKGTTVPSMNWTPWPNLTRTTPCDLSWDRRNTDGTVTTFLDPRSQYATFVNGSC